MMVFYLQVYFLQIHNLHLIMKKKSQNPNERIFYKLLNQQNCQGNQKQGKS